MAEAGRDRTLRVLRGSNQYPGTLGVPATRDRPLAAHAPTTQPAGRHHLGSHGEARRRLAPQTAYPSPVAEPTLCRYPPEVGGGCLNRARPDLGGGHSVMGGPTAKNRFQGFWPKAFLADQSLALRKSTNPTSNRRSWASGGEAGRASRLSGVPRDLARLDDR